MFYSVERGLGRSHRRGPVIVGVAVAAEDHVVDDEDSARHRDDEPLHPDQVLGDVEHANHHHRVQLQLGCVDLNPRGGNGEQ